MVLQRCSGILLHPTSLPGKYGIGEIGEQAYHFIDFLVETKQKLWQTLPLGPTGYGDSPYASFSSFAGNPLLISIRDLVLEGFLSMNDIAEVPDFPEDFIDYGWVITWKKPLLVKAAEQFKKGLKGQLKEEFGLFKKQHSHWLDDYALFMSIKEHFDKKAARQNVDNSIWYKFWDKEYAIGEQKALKAWQSEHEYEIEIHKIWQYFFFSQWRKVKQYANSRGIQIIGDIPIFVAPDSVDVWANKGFFHLDDTGAPTVVSGVPPDYFSATGQLWGNPLYDWGAMEKDGFSWWIARIKGLLNLVDIIRIDHFRGFEAYWEVPAGEDTAVNGRWVKAKGNKLFAEVKKELGNLPIIVEDLGLITKEVNDLREKWEFPGMEVLQFGFDLDKHGEYFPGNPFSPHNHKPNSIVYTGSHDNNTLRGWYDSISEDEKDAVRKYMARDDHDIVWDFIRMAESSVAAYALIPMQDIMELDSSARMNTPSTLGGNWCWRYRDHQINDYMKSRLKEMTIRYGRSINHG